LRAELLSAVRRPRKAPPALTGQQSFCMLVAKDGILFHPRIGLSLRPRILWKSALPRR